jgi:hypothetical protein
MHLHGSSNRPFLNGHVAHELRRQCDLPDLCGSDKSDNNKSPYQAGDNRKGQERKYEGQGMPRVVVLTTAGRRETASKSLLRSRNRDSVKSMGERLSIHARYA